MSSDGADKNFGAVLYHDIKYRLNPSGLELMRS